MLKIEPTDREFLERVTSTTQEYDFFNTVASVLLAIIRDIEQREEYEQEQREHAET